MNEKHVKEPDFSQKDLTFGELLDYPMTITDPEEAGVFLGKYVSYLIEHWGESEQSAQDIARKNIGYCAGYYGTETQERMERLFGAVHPFLGSTSGAQFSPEQVFALGYERGKRAAESPKG